MTKEIPLKVHAKKGGKRVFDCAEELTAFFTCLQTKGEGNCQKEQDALMQCTVKTAAKPKPQSTINYHLQRIARRIKR